MAEEQCCKRSFAESLWDSAKRFVKDPVPVPQEVSDYRLALCDVCEKFKDGKCEECGCIMRIKTKFSEMECPVGRWGKHEKA
jgi:hypothetical protein